MPDQPEPVRDNEEDFDAAWNEATAPEGTPKQEAEPEAAPPPEADTEPDEQPVVEAESEPEATPTQEDVSRVKQELQTWQGRRKKAEQEALEWEQRLEQAKQKTEPPPEQTQESQGYLSDEEREQLSQFREEYPSLGPAVELAAKEIVAKMFAEQLPNVVKTQVEPIREESRKTLEEMHFAQIAEAHNDYRDVLADERFKDWIDDLPHRDAVKWESVVNKGTAPEVIEMLTEHKRWLGNGSQSSNNASASTHREAQLRAAEPVRARSGGPPPGKPDKDDFDAAWEEATRMPS